MEIENSAETPLRKNPKRNSSNFIDHLDIEIFKTPLKNIKLERKSSLSNTEKSLAYLHSKVCKTPKKIAIKLGRTKKAITNFLDKVKTTNTFQPKNQNKGRFKKGSVNLNQRQKDLLQKWLKNDEIHSVRQCTFRLNSIRNFPKTSYKSVNNYLKTLGGFVRPKLKSLISAKNKKLRVEYCTKYRDFNFNKAIFTDESSFQMNSNNLRSFRFKGKTPPRITKYNPNYSFMVWGGISYKGKTSLHFVQGKVNATYYQNIITEKSDEMKRIFYRRGKWYFVQDSAPSHRPNVVKEFIKSTLGCELLKHPAQSPDLNPIELVWAQMKSKIEAKRPKNKSELKIAIEREWKNITINFIRKCIDNLHTKMDKVLNCNGDLL